MRDKTEYVIRTDVLCRPLERFDVGALADATAHPWFNQTLSQVNDAVLRLGLLQGEFHWHKHDGEDELFFVVEGELTIEVEGGRSIVLGPKQGVTIPKGVSHRPVSRDHRTMVLMIEAASVQPTGD